MEKVSVFILRVQNKSRITLIIWKQMVLNNTFRLDITLKNTLLDNMFTLVTLYHLGSEVSLKITLKGDAKTYQIHCCRTPSRQSGGSSCVQVSMLLAGDLRTHLFKHTDGVMFAVLVMIFILIDEGTCCVMYRRLRR